MNFIFFNPDEMRAESLSTYGHPLAPTPHFNRLATRGTTFNQCHVQHTVCTPSRCSFMTGWYPHVRGHRSLWHPLQKDEPNLLSYLKNAGYTVLWGGKNDLLSPDALPLSCDDWDLSARSTRRQNGRSWSVTPPHLKLEDPLYYSMLYEPLCENVEQLGDFAAVDGAIEFLKSKPSEPFALYLPISFPHCPYWAPGKWHDLVNPDDLPPLRPPNLDGKPDFHEAIRQTRRLNELGDADFRKINAVYLGMCGVVDALLGELMDALDQTGLNNSTTLMAFSDHGDWAGDFGLVEKWPSALDDTLTRVPLLISTPDGAPNHRVEEPVELFDIMATTLSLAGIEARHDHFARDLSPQLGGESGDATRAVFCEGGYDAIYNGAPHDTHAFEGRQGTDQAARDQSHIYYPKARLQQERPETVSRAAMIRTASHKLIYRPNGTSELYDLARDPREQRNRFGQSEASKVQADLQTRLLDWSLQTSDVTPHQEDPRGFPPMPFA